jgi:hypothetical protein
MLAASVCILAATIAPSQPLPGLSAIAFGVLGLYVMISGIGETKGPRKLE